LSGLAYASRLEEMEGGGALKRAFQRAREIARMHGTPLYFCKNGKVVALKP